MGWQIELSAFGVFDETSIDAPSPRDHGKPTPIHGVIAEGQRELETLPFDRTNTSTANKVDFDRYVVADDALQIIFQCLRSIR